MLVLSRKSQERIQIGDQITISILAVKGNVVRIGIEAPTNIHIVRGELPPLEKNPGAPVTAENPTPVGDAASTPAQPQVARCPAQATEQRSRLSMNRHPSLKARLSRRLHVLRGELAATS